MKDHYSVSFTGMPIQPSLETLDLSSSSLTTMAGMPILPKLKSLRLYSVEDFSGMPTLPELSKLELWNETNLSAIPKQPKLNDLVIYNHPLEDYKLPFWLTLETVKAGVRSQADIVALSRAAPHLKKAEFILAMREQLNWTNLTLLDSLEEISLYGRLNELKFLLEIKNLKIVRLTTDHDLLYSLDPNDYKEAATVSNDIDFGSLEKLKKDIKISVECYECGGKMSAELRSRTEIVSLPDRF
jgi:hypothetical protein